MKNGLLVSTQPINKNIQVFWFWYLPPSTFQHQARKSTKTKHVVLKPPVAAITQRFSGVGPQVMKRHDNWKGQRRWVSSFFPVDLFGGFKSDLWKGAKIVTLIWGIKKSSLGRSCFKCFFWWLIFFIPMWFDNMFSSSCRKNFFTNYKVGPY